MKSMKTQQGYTLIELFIGGGLVVGVATLVAGIIGWVRNIFKLVGMIGEDPELALFILRIVGVFFPPLGGIMGYL